MYIVLSILIAKKKNNEIKNFAYADLIVLFFTDCLMPTVIYNKNR